MLIRLNPLACIHHGLVSLLVEMAEESCVARHLPCELLMPQIADLTTETS